MTHANMDNGARNWLIGFVHKNTWRLKAPGYEFQDLLQEGYLCWQLVLLRYPAASDRAHIMALFKASFRNRVLDLSRRDRVRGSYFPGVDVDELPLMHREMTCETADLCRMVCELPMDISQAIKAMITGNVLQAPMRRRRDGTRETLNERLCRCIGKDHAHRDLPMEIKSALGSRNVCTESHHV
jgi:hypothetical protein